jgi:hypothetical protein
VGGKNVQRGEQITHAEDQQGAGKQRAHADRQLLEMPVQPVDRLVIHIN